MVAPMAMITAGVHNGSKGPLLYEEDDIKKAVPAWNMKPIVVYHPAINGGGISAADQDVLEKQQVGMLMNTEFRDGKLRAEAWIEEELANNVDERVMEALTNNKVMEVSTGLFTTDEPTSGEYGDKAYTHIARNHQPDHLALLPDQVGACSVADGAGLLVANAGAGFEGAEVMEVARHIVANKMSHSNVYQGLSRELEKKVPRKRKGVGDDSHMVGPWITDVYDKFFIYEMEGTLYRLNYTNGKGGVEITGDADEVVRVTEYRTAETGKFVGNSGNLTKNKNKTTMKIEEIVDGLISNADTTYTEDDREALMNTDEAILNKMDFAKKKKGDDEEDDEGKKKKATKNAEGEDDDPAGKATPATDPTANSTDAYIDAAPPEIKEVLRNGLNAHNAEQEKLVKEITDNADNTFTEEFLRNKGLEELKGIAALAKKPVENTAPHAPGTVPMFIGANTPAGPTANANGHQEESALDAPVMNFDKDHG